MVTPDPPAINANTEDSRVDLAKGLGVPGVDFSGDSTTTAAAPLRAAGVPLVEGGGMEGVQV